MSMMVDAWMGVMLCVEGDSVLQVRGRITAAVNDCSTELEIRQAVSQGRASRVRRE